MLREQFYDAIVVGAGFSGSVVAAKIAKEGVNPSNGERLKVALIEGGPYYQGKPIWGYGNPLRRQMFTHIPQDMKQGERPGRPMFPGATHPFQYLGVGGGSLQWGAQSEPPHDDDYEWWARETGVDWTKKKMRPAVEEILRVFNSHSIPEHLLGEYHLRFRDVVESLGYKTERVIIHKKNCILCGGHVSGTPHCRYDAKMSTLLTHIPVAEDNGVEILPDTLVEKVMIEQRGAEWASKGVWYRGYGETGPARKVEAKKVILAGFMGTILLLYRSGYGPKDFLGDQLLVENHNVGSNIDGHLHPQVFGGVAARFDDFPVGGPEEHGFGFYFLDDEDRQGRERLYVANHVDSQGIGFFGAQTYALSPWAPEFGHKHKEWMRKQMWRHTGGLSAQYSHWPAPKARLRPDGSWDFNPDHPAIQKRKREKNDLLRTIFQKMGAKEIRENPGRRGTQLFTGMVGGCRAGRSRKNSVVNPDFECHDIANLFVVDPMSVPRMYSLGGGGFVATIVATFAAQRIIANHFKRG